MLFGVRVLARRTAEPAVHRSGWTALRPAFRTRAGARPGLVACPLPNATQTVAIPADTLRVERFHRQMPENCMVETSHLNITLAGVLLDAVIPAQFSGYTRLPKAGPCDTSNGQPAVCVSHEDPALPIGHVDGITPAGEDDGKCIDNSTALFHGSHWI